MTCVVGMIKNGTVYIGADSAGSSTWDIRDRADKKVFINGPMIFGFTSSFRMGQLLRHKLVIPNHPKDKDLYAYMVTDFIDAVRTCLKDGGYMHVSDSRETGGQFLVGYRGRLFYVDSDLQVGEHREKFDSVGCGSSYALGALAASTLPDPFKRLRKALEVSERFSNGVRGPFYFEQLKKGRNNG